MRELAARLSRWHAANTVYVLATVVRVTGSAPRPAGATMAVDEAGNVRGSLSGGCVEGEVYELCREVLESGVPVRRTFGYSDADAFAVGLTCGGELEIVVHRITPAEYPAVEAALDPAGPMTFVRDLATGAVAALGPASAVGAHFDDAVVRQARAMLCAGATGVRVVGCADRERTVFIESFASAPRMLVFGATDFTTALCGVGRLLGYRVTVCEARPAFADHARMPDADEVVRDWPDRYLRRTRVDARTVICVLTHDPKFDIPVLTEALRLPVAYVGAMGSRRADRDRRRRLRAAGLTEHELRRLHSPIGLELGGRTPEETAVAIGAEIVAVRHGGSARSLSDTERPIHPVETGDAAGEVIGIRSR
ncbi:XdhC family protein [Nocardia implantans]|uniref:XdhC family protein n=1 Tax=Nocardia implantans TaxID=3108168 RepID=A0ABU6ARS8_9NOCA|nr:MULTISPECIES: XdhC family protein [unclassified Nocardia]MBF6191622.1 XdhC family protein [Nocardia beijingensis]MEA3528071.1 XdhC family protein [Nocardia sp. CDC192]MEB3510177.1 XdhC family protein [Nocardia sp. CDC186]